MFPRTVTIRTRSLVADRLRPRYTQSRRNYAAAVLKSPYEDVTVPDQTLPQFLWSRSSQWEDLPVVSCGVSGRSYTFGMAKMLTEQCAKALVANLSLEQGDRIGLLMPNIPEYLIGIHGCLDAGFVPTFANPLYTTDEIARQYTNAGVRCIVTIPQLLDNALEVSRTLHNYTYTINVGGKTEPERKILGLQEILAPDYRDVKLPKVSPDDVAILPYSSGTTGLPKGVSLTHRNLVANIAQVSHPEVSDVRTPTCLEDQEVALSVLPFFHIYGFNAILNFCAYNGIHTVTLPRFTTEDYLRCLVEYRPTGIFAVPSLILFLATHPDVDVKHLESVKRVICAAAPIGSSIIRKLRDKIKRDDLTFEQAYGMTETSPGVLMTPKAQSALKTGSVGRLLPMTEAKLIDLTDKAEITSSKKSGELLIKGPQVMKEYLKNPEATNDILDSEGWLHTGDVAYYDDDEYFYIIDRTKELIKVKGNQVSPTELESILMGIPGVLDCAVVGKPDQRAGELPMAFIVKAPDSDLTADVIKNHVAPKVAPYKKLEGGIKFVDAIPRNPSGKIVRNQLKSMN